MSFRVSVGTAADGPEVLVLLPRVGAFPRPPHRANDEVHRMDVPVIRAWIEGGEPDCSIFVARDDAGALVGFALTRMQEDSMSGEMSAHLETLAVAEAAQGQGIGAALMQIAEDAARERGARSMTLNVFETNERARALYARKGYIEELIRCIKPLVRDRDT